MRADHDGGSVLVVKNPSSEPDRQGSLALRPRARVLRMMRIAVAQERHCQKQGMCLEQHTHSQHAPAQTSILPKGGQKAWFPHLKEPRELNEGRRGENLQLKGLFVITICH